MTKALFFLFVYLFSSNSCLPYFFSAPEQVFDKHMPQWCNLFEWIYRSGFPLFVSSGIRGRILRKRRWKLRNHDIHFQINVKWFEFGGTMWSCSLIVRVRVVFVGCGDWHSEAEVVIRVKWRDIVSQMHWSSSCKLIGQLSCDVNGHETQVASFGRDCMICSLSLSLFLVLHSKRRSQDTIFCEGHRARLQIKCTLKRTTFFRWWWWRILL